MVNRNLIRGLDLNKEEWEQELAAALGGTATDEIDWGGEELTVNQILDGKILRVDGDSVLVDVGYKSEGTIALNEWEEWEDPPQAGQTRQSSDRGRRRRLWPHRRITRHDRPLQAQGREGRSLAAR